mgnify:CR=1 FL=1
MSTLQRARNQPSTAYYCGQNFLPDGWLRGLFEASAVADARLVNVLVVRDFFFFVFALPESVPPPGLASVVHRVPPLLPIRVAFLGFVEAHALLSLADLGHHHFRKMDLESGCGCRAPHEARLCPVTARESGKR